MTIHVVCAVKDRASRTFGRFFSVPHPNAAIRSFTDEVNRPGTVDQVNDLFAHPDDYELYDLGCFDDAIGVLSSPVSGPNLLVRGKDVSRRTDIEPTKYIELNGGTDTRKSVLV